MNVLIVGGAGYVGGAVTDLLIKTAHRVRVYDALFYEDAYRKPVDFVFGDVRDHDRLKAELQKTDIVVWLVAIVGDPACSLFPDTSVVVNQDSVEWLTANFDGRIIFTSSCSVYGMREEVLDEEAPTKPLSIYADTKLKAEAFLKGKNALVLRLGTLFGVGDLYSRIRLDLIVNLLTVRAHQFGKLTVYGGEQFRPLLHVKDTAKCIIDNLTTDKIGIFNVHKENMKILDLAKQVREHFPDITISQQSVPFEDMRNYRVSSDRAKEQLGFAPSYSVDDGIKEIKSLLVSQRIKDVDNPRYTNKRFLAEYHSHIRR